MLLVDRKITRTHNGVEMRFASSSCSLMLSRPTNVFDALETIVMAERMPAVICNILPVSERIQKGRA